MRDDLIRLNNNADVKYFSIFLRWLKNKGAYYNFSRAITKKYNYGYTYEILYTFIERLHKRGYPDFINQLLGWSATEDGWDYWFRLNNQWKDYVRKQWHIVITF